MDLYGGNRLPPPIPRSSQHELKRPDSVITTSSIVSSDTASQAGDSSTEASGEPFQKHTFTVALLTLFWLFYLKSNDNAAYMWVIKQNKYKKKKFCVLQKKVLSFGPNRTVEVRPNSLAGPNIRSVTTSHPME